jgi:DNA-binding NarL/FixJ family response regulator
VLIADDHRLVRDGLKAILETAKDIEIIGEATDGKQAVELTRKLRPDVLLMDISMPGLDGIRAIQEIRSGCLPTRVLVMSMCSDPPVVQQALDNGASGFLLKDWKRDELVGGIRAATRGETFLSRAVADLLSEGHT